VLPRRSSAKSAVRPIAAKNSRRNGVFALVSKAKRSPLVRSSSSAARAKSRPPTIGRRDAEAGQHRDAFHQQVAHDQHQAAGQERRKHRQRH
jgi:hypothetical protein